MTIRVDTVTMTPVELEHLLDGAALRRTTDNGADVWLHGATTTLAQPQGTWAVPVGEFMGAELEASGRSAYTRQENPFVLDIQLAN